MPTSSAAQRSADFTRDHFALFGLAPAFALDVEALTQAWRRLQAAVHPDRFAGAGAAQMRLAMQWSTQVNTAYRALKDPLQRAAYLCELRGVPIDAQRNTAMPADFLMQQMEWRERLDEARGDAADLPALAAEVERAHAAVLARLAALLDSDAPAATQAAAAQVRILMFIEKFRHDLAPLLAQDDSSTPAVA
jgi:molecular chaperone HscB